MVNITLTTPLHFFIIEALLPLMEVTSLPLEAATYLTRENNNLIINNNNLNQNHVSFAIINSKNGMHPFAYWTLFYQITSSRA